MSRRDSNTERVGVIRTSLIFTEELEWVFRESATVDIGIDAVVEQSVKGDPTGKFLAVQIKSGSGNFYETQKHYTHYVSNIHHNYWLGLNIPIILVGYFPEKQTALWTQVNETNFERTESRWKIKLSKDNELNLKSNEELSYILENSSQDSFYLKLNPTDYHDENFDGNLPNGAEKIEIASKSLRDTNSLFENFSNKTASMTAKLDTFSSKNIKRYDSKMVQSINNYATYLTKISKELDNYVQIFAINFANGFRDYEKLSTIHFIVTKNHVDAVDTINSIFEISSNFIDAIIATKNLKDSINELPKDFPKLKKAKKTLLKPIDTWHSELLVAADFCDSFIARLKYRITHD